MSSKLRVWFCFWGSATFFYTTLTFFICLGNHLCTTMKTAQVADMQKPAYSESHSQLLANYVSRLLPAEWRKRVGLLMFDGMNAYTDGAHG